MKKKTMYAEAAYVLGVLALAFGTALSARADFGMSMVVAPAYLVHLKVSALFPWFSFGMAEYCLQAILLVVIGLILHRFKPLYLFSFVTAVIYGIVLDLSVAVVNLIPGDGMGLRLVFYVLGLVLCALGVALLFETYLAPEAYELFVKEIAEHFKLDRSKTKTVYDLVSCAAAILLSFVFFDFGKFEGVKLGTVICALVNGWNIGKFSAWIRNRYEIKDCFSLRHYFE